MNLFSAHTAAIQQCACGAICSQRKESQQPIKVNYLIVGRERNDCSEGAKERQSARLGHIWLWCSGECMYLEYAMKLDIIGSINNTNVLNATNVITL